MVIRLRARDTVRQVPPSRESTPNAFASGRRDRWSREGWTRKGSCAGNGPTIAWFKIRPATFFPCSRQATENYFLLRKIMLYVNHVYHLGHSEQTCRLMNFMVGHVLFSIYAIQGM